MLDLSEGRRSVFSLVYLLAVLGCGLFPQSLLGQNSNGLQHQPATGEYHLVAVRVSFQPDSSRFTTGDGTFDGQLFDGLEPTLDPLPHSPAYFQAHLDFLSNYVSSASSGRASVVTHLLPNEVRVSGQMSAYSPIGENSDSDEEVAKLAALVDEVWLLADQQDLPTVSLSPGRTVFVILHAGVGRDIELIGTTLDKTPFDLPSLFFGGSRLADFSVQRTFDGVPVDNSLLIPRTETRQGFDFVSDSAFLAEFSINGLLAASFLNFLGVPDLFDTATGQSAIGPYGLMDPLGIFSYRGLMPALPSAWVRAYLGWIDVTQAVPGTNTVEAAANCPNNCAVMVPVSPTEYFLLENRDRFAMGNTLNLQVWNNGQLNSLSFSNDDPAFNYRNVESFSGVLVSADNYDWALPGGVDENGAPLRGGILIWHIDESRIIAGLRTNTVNVASKGRGVDLEEADSGQDLGHPAQSIFAPDFDLGTPFDFFYEGNPVSVVTQRGGQIALYQNRFSANTFPSSENNAGGESGIVLESFSAPGSTMTFDFSVEATAAGELLTGFPFLVIPPFALQPIFTSNSGAEVSQIGHAGDRILVKHSATDASYLLTESNPTFVYGFEVGDAAETSSGVLFHVNRIASDSLRGVVATADGNFHRRAWPIPGGGSDAVVTSRVVAVPGGDVAFILASSGQEQNQVVEIAGNTSSSVATDPGIGHPRSLAVSQEGLIIAGEHGLQTADSVWVLDSSAELAQIVAGNDRHGFLAAGIDTTGGLLYLFDSSGAREIVLDSHGFHHPSDLTVITTDLDGDNLIDILVYSGQKIQGFSRNGGVTGSTPIALSGAIDGQPISILTDTGEPILMYNTVEGYLHARYPNRGWREEAGFPIATGRHSGSPYFDDGKIYVGRELLYVWDTNLSGRILWNGAGGGSAHSHFVDLGTASGGGTEFLLNPAETYNWPNPIRSNRTNLRVTSARSGTANIEIVDAAGNNVAVLEGLKLLGGVPAETPWDVTDVSSGVYIAKVHFVGDDGQSDSRLIKMAVIK